MSKIPLGEIDRYDDEETVERFKKRKESNAKNRHSKTNKKHHINNKDID